MNHIHQEQNVGNSHATSVNKRRIYVVILSVIMTVSLVLNGYLLTHQKIKTTSIENSEKKTSISDETEKKLCKDIVDIKKLTSRWYISCSNGLVIESDGSSITQVWTEQELGSDEISSMAADDNNLYIGNNGLTIIDLSDYSIKRFDHTNGMRTVGNTQLALDGSSLWIGTFGDIYEYEIENKEINAVTEALGEINIDAEQLISTANAIYAGTPANLFRYDKKLSEWSDISSDEIDDSLARGPLVYAGEKLYKIVTPQDELEFSQLWYRVDSADAKWQQANNFTQRIANEFELILGYGPDLTLVGYEDDGGVIVKVEQFEDVIHYYINVDDGGIDYSRNELQDNYNHLGSTKINWIFANTERLNEELQRI